MTHHRIMAGLAVLAAATAHAHPHASTDQQAHLTLGRHKTTVVYHITPSMRDDGHMFDHIDSDGNGLLSGAERRAFADALLKATRFRVDGKSVALVVSGVAFPARATLARGEGVIRVQAEASVRLNAGQPHMLSFRLRYHSFAPRWHIQPFLHRDLEEASLHISRPAGGDEIVLIL